MVRCFHSVGVLLKAWKWLEKRLKHIGWIEGHPKNGGEAGILDPAPGVFFFSLFYKADSARWLERGNPPLVAWQKGSAE